MTMKHPENVPAQPAPVMARPAMKVSLFRATAWDIQRTAHESMTDGPLTAYQTADLEDENTQQEDGLHRKVLVCLSPH
jgi:hypothetical protein